MAKTSTERTRKWRAMNHLVTIPRAKLEELMQAATIGALTPELAAERDAFIFYTDEKHHAVDHDLLPPQDGPDAFLGFTSAAWTGLGDHPAHEDLIDIVGMREAVDSWRTRAAIILRGAGKLVPSHWRV